MTSRLGWVGCDPSALWYVWDRFNIKDAQMTGYWDPNLPVICNNNNVKVTVYRRADKMLIAYGSWAGKDVNMSLDIKWNEVKLRADEVRI